MWLVLTALCCPYSPNNISLKEEEEADQKEKENKKKRKKKKKDMMRRWGGVHIVNRESASKEVVVSNLQMWESRAGVCMYMQAYVSIAISWPSSTVTLHLTSSSSETNAQWIMKECWQPAELFRATQKFWQCRRTISDTKGEWNESHCKINLQLFHQQSQSPEDMMQSHHRKVQYSEVRIIYNLLICLRCDDLSILCKKQKIIDKCSSKNKRS